MARFDAIRKMRLPLTMHLRTLPFAFNNEALVSVYVYDESLNTTNNPAVPDYCSSAEVVGNKVAYIKTLH
jgi:hypothetical protein